MKMKVADRVLLTIFILFIMLVCVALIGIAINLIPAENAASMIRSTANGWPMVVLIAVSVILFLIGLRLLVAGFIPGKPLSTVLVSTDLGVIRVSITTLDTLTQKAVRSFQEVKDVKSVVLPDPEGTRIQLKVTILPDVVMPELSKAIQSKVKEYVESLSGITVKEVQIYIDNLSVAKPIRVE